MKKLILIILLFTGSLSADSYMICSGATCYGRRILFGASLCLTDGGIGGTLTIDACSGAAPGGAAGGDLSGTYPNPGVAKVNGNTPGNTCAAKNFVSSISSSAVGSCTQPSDVTGNAATATALAANGTNCSTGNFPLGVDASGNAESCTALPTTITGTANQISASAATGAITLSIPTNPTLPGTTSGTFSGSLSGNASTATTAGALTANGTNCTAGQFPLGVDASGNSESCTALPTTIVGTANQITASAATGTVTLSIPSSPTLPGTTTGTFSGALSGNATTATALAANGTNCSGNNFALGVDASGNGECAQPAFSNLSGTATNAQLPQIATVGFGTVNQPTCSVGGVTTYLGYGTGTMSTSEGSVGRWIAPVALTFKTLYIKLGGNVPASQSAVFALMKNTSAQTVTCTVAAGASTCNDTSNSFTVVAGDLVDLRVICSGGTTALTNSVSGTVTTY